MPARILIVEDEMLVAGHIEMILEDMGHLPVGIATTFDEVRRMAQQKPDIALVDCNLRDGLTGPSIGAWLTEQGVSVVFMTANPSVLRPELHKALGVVSKPCGDECLGGVMAYVTALREGRVLSPPAKFFPFPA